MRRRARDMRRADEESAAAQKMGRFHDQAPSWTAPAAAPYASTQTAQATAPYAASRQQAEAAEESRTTSTITQDGVQQRIVSKWETAQRLYGSVENLILAAAIGGPSEVMREIEELQQDEKNGCGHAN